jgi:hypothetical protein
MNLLRHFDSFKLEWDRLKPLEDRLSELAEYRSHGTARFRDCSKKTASVYQCNTR